MKITIGIIAALVAALSIGATTASASTGDQLNAAASYVAGRSVVVHCMTHAQWIHYGDAVGEDYSYVLGFTFPLAAPPYNSTVWIEQSQCTTLGLLFNNTTNDVGPAEASLAVHTLVHEATHLGLSSTDEHLVDCTALRKDAGVATSFFGVSPTQTKVSYLPVKRHGHTVRMRRVTRRVPSQWLTRFEGWDQQWHDWAPAPYSGPC